MLYTPLFQIMYNSNMWEGFKFLLILSEHACHVKLDEFSLHVMMIAIWIQGCSQDMNQVALNVSMGKRGTCWTILKTPTLGNAISLILWAQLRTFLKTLSPLQNMLKIAMQSKPFLTDFSLPIISVQPSFLPCNNLIITLSYHSLQ